MPKESADREKFYSKLEHVLNVPAGSLKGEQELRSIAGWDSLAILEVMMMASTEYDSDVEPTDLATCKTVDDLTSTVFAARSSLK